MTLYATLAQAKVQMQAGSGDVLKTAEGEARLLRNLRTVSRRVDLMLDPLYKREVFAPQIATRPMRVSPTNVNSYDGTLRLSGSLLAFTSVILGTSALTTVEAWPPGITPVEYLRLTGCCDSWYHDPGCPENSGPLLVQVTGVWGLHRDYANAWQSVDVLQADIAAEATAFTVADAAAVDTFGLSPRLSPGHLARIEDEFMEVTAVNGNAATVRRGVNGTTAAAHASGTAVETFVIESPINYVVARQAGLMTARYGTYTTVEVQGMGTEVRYPVDLLAELKNTLAEYAYDG